MSQSAALVPLGGCPTARATWGDVCSPARRISVSMKAGACMKPDYLGVFGVLVCPLPVLIVDTGMPWEFMEINLNLWSNATVAEFFACKCPKIHDPLGIDFTELCGCMECGYNMWWILPVANFSREIPKKEGQHSAN